MSLDWSLDDIIKANRKASKAIQGVGSNKRRSESSPYSYDKPKVSYCLYEAISILNVYI